MIVVTDTDLEQCLKYLLQETVEFVINDKVWRKGKILLFRQSGFYIEFTVQTSSKLECFEVPIPFNNYIEIINNQLIFDYTLKEFCNCSDGIDKILPFIEILPKSKFHDTELLINIRK